MHSTDSTPDKQRSELLGTRHFLTGQVTVQPQEEMHAYDTFIRQMTESFAPGSILEHQLAQSYATFQWRINRAAAIEESLFTLGNMEQIAENLNLAHAQIHNAVSNAKTFRDQSAVFARIAMCSQRLMHQAETVLKRLLQLQSERKLHQENDLAEAARLYQLHETHKQEFDPHAHGFEFTLGEIQAFVRRRTLHLHALQAARRNPPPLAFAA